MSDQILLEKFDYAVTIQIPAFKRVNYQNEYKAYKSFHNEQQKLLIRNLLLNAYNSAVSFNLQHSIKLHYESHSDGRIHAHFTLSDLHEYQIRDIQTKFCSYIGIKTLKQSFDVFYYETKRTQGWEHYCTKETLADLEADLENI